MSKLKELFLYWWQFDLVYSICLIVFFIWAGYDCVKAIRTIVQPEVYTAFSKMFWFIISLGWILQYRITLLSRSKSSNKEEI